MIKPIQQQEAEKSITGTTSDRKLADSPKLASANHCSISCDIGLGCPIPKE